MEDKRFYWKNSQFDLTTVCCPTCGQHQEWHTECKRCGSDLTLLLQAAEHWFLLQSNVAKAMLAGNRSQARQYLYEAIAICPTPPLQTLIRFLTTTEFHSIPEASDSLDENMQQE